MRDDLIRCLLCVLLLAGGGTCVATPLPIPPSVDTERLKLIETALGRVELTGQPGAISVDGISAVRVASPGSWSQAAMEVDGAFVTVLGGTRAEVFYLEGVVDGGVQLLAAVTGAPTPGDVVLAELGPDGDGDGWPDAIDCAPDDRAVHEDCGCTVEACNGRDDDCDGVIDEGCEGTVGLDLDGDDFTTPADCNDFDPLVYPGAPELCNGLDDDCDGAPEEACPGVLDEDEDGFETPDDCDDADPRINPSADEVCNGVDEDCNDLIDDACSGVCRNRLDCGWGECDEGACVCPAGRRACAFQCVDTDVDPNHCGGCGVVCPSGTCVGGRCE